MKGKLIYLAANFLRFTKPDRGNRRGAICHNISKICVCGVALWVGIQNPMTSISARIRGSLYGVAIVDALGGPVEFHPRGTFPPVTSFRHNPNFNLEPGTWTDDTSMTLCLAQSLVDTHGIFVAKDQVEKYISWYENGYMSATGKCFDIGMATRTALTIWSDFFQAHGGKRGNKKTKKKKNNNNKKEEEEVEVEEEEEENEKDGVVDAHLAGQVLINKALNHEVCGLPLPLCGSSYSGKEKSLKITPERFALQMIKERQTFSTIQVQCGNGSLMRLTPIPLIYHFNPTLALHNAALSSILTHPHPTNTEACKIYTHLLTLILSHPSPSSPSPSSASASSSSSPYYSSSIPTIITKSTLASALSTYPFSTPKLRSRFAKYTRDVASFAAVKENEIKSTGFVIDTLEAALWGFFTTDGFRQGALKVVNLGGDADTVGAVYGGLAGAFYGIDGLPEEWMDGLVKRDMVEGVVDGVLRLVEEMGGKEASVYKMA